MKVQNTFHGRNNNTFSTNCKYRIAATLYTLDMVCLRYRIVNNLHKCDNKDDDDDDNDDNDDDDDDNNNNNNNNRRT